MLIAVDALSFLGQGLCCFPRTLLDAEERSRKEMPVSDSPKTEKCIDPGHEELDILSTQEEMFPENNVPGNNRQSKQE